MKRTNVMTLWRNLCYACLGLCVGDIKAYIECQEDLLDWFEDCHDAWFMGAFPKVTVTRYVHHVDLSCP